MAEPLVYLNGQTVPASQAHVAIFDAGIVFGATVTEMTRTFHHRPWRLEQHLDRLYDSLKHVRFDVRETEAELRQATLEIATHNAGLLADEDEIGIIHFITAGEYTTYSGAPATVLGRQPTVCCHTYPLPWERWASKMRLGARVVTPSIRHVPPECYDPSMKYRSRLHFYLADQEVRLADPEALALLLDLDGNVTETSAANFFIVENGAIVSPTTRNILPGVSRATVVELARILAIPFVERDFPIESALNAEEAFLTTTPYCIMPVTGFNNAPIRDGKPGPVYRRLIDAWSELVGLDVALQIQLGAKRRQRV